jgi:hypothetical protein
MEYEKRRERSRFPAAAFGRGGETNMTSNPRPPQDLPSGDQDIAQEGEENRREIDEVPEPGTDPLHEGP